jgi:uncharacterized protein (TIGR00730 family)
VVTNDVQQLELQLPILAGFAYPVQALEFTVTMPGPISVKPAFSSGYHQANIEKDLYCTVSGATITGVVPDKLIERNIVSTLLDENIPVHSLGERKEVMLRESDLFIALPGGLGTLDEVFHVLGESSIGYHSKPMILYNINGCWDSLLNMIDDLRHQGLLRHDLSKRLILANSLADIHNFIDSWMFNKDKQ